MMNGESGAGYVAGTENAADEDSRQEIAVEKETGGSYVVRVSSIIQPGPARPFTHCHIHLLPLYRRLSMCLSNSKLMCGL